MSDTDPTSGLTAYARELLRGRLVRLRPFEDTDASQLAEWWNDPEWMVLQQPHVLPTGSTAAEQLFRGWSANPGETGFGYSIVDDEGTLVGHVTMWGIAPTTRIGTLAIVIGAPYVDCGYGTDAVTVALRLAFEEMGVNKVELRVWSFNERARHVYTRLGFVEEGRRRAAVFHRSRFFDEVLMGMLSAEYVASRPDPSTT